LQTAEIRRHLNINCTPSANAVNQVTNSSRRFTIICL